MAQTFQFRRLEPQSTWFHDTILSQAQSSRRRAKNACKCAQKTQHRCRRLITNHHVPETHPLGSQKGLVGSYNTVAGPERLQDVDKPKRLQDVDKMPQGDVALVDTARPVKHLSRFRSTQWLTFRLPRKSVRSHLGFEPLGGVSKRRTRVSRRLFDLIGDADTESTPSSADPYLQLAVYDLVGALFAPLDPPPIWRARDKLFVRISSTIKDGFVDPDFEPAEVAAEAGISLRYVAVRAAGRIANIYSGRNSNCSNTD